MSGTAEVVVLLDTFRTTGTTGYLKNGGRFEI